MQSTNMDQYNINHQNSNFIVPESKTLEDFSFSSQKLKAKINTIKKKDTRKFNECNFSNLKNESKYKKQAHLSPSKSKNDGTIHQSNNGQSISRNLIEPSIFDKKLKHAEVDYLRHENAILKKEASELVKLEGRWSTDEQNHNNVENNNKSIKYISHSNNDLYQNRDMHESAKRVKETTHHDLDQLKSRSKN